MTILQEISFSVLICGGGYVGLSLGLALKKAEPSLKVCVLDARAPEKSDQDARSVAVAPPAQKMLDVLGVWNDLAAFASPITSMIVTDSSLDEPVRPVFLNFGSEKLENEETASQEDTPLAFMVPNGLMISNLRQRAIEAGICYHAPAAIISFEENSGGVDVDLEDGRQFKTSLLIGADGVHSFIRQRAGIKDVRWMYDQCAVVTTIAHEKPHHGRAEEHFLPSGPFAVLPLTDHRSSLVWSEKEEDAQHLVSCSEEDFLKALYERLGHHLGAVRLDGRRAYHPLGLMLARSYVKGRVVLAGDAAHAIHPIAGQGLNLGFHDVAALCECLVEAHRLGLDIGACDALDVYQSMRRPSNVQMAIVTDQLNRLFSNDYDVLRFIRSTGLKLVDQMQPLKRSFMRSADGTSEDLPKLMRGLLP